MDNSKASSVLALWGSRRFDTWDIAQLVGIHEAEVERIIHADREARRKAGGIGEETGPRESGAAVITVRRASSC